MVFMLFLFSQCRTIRQPDEYYCNLLAGEPTQTSVILQARLHKTDTLINNDIQGIEGYIKFSITRDIESGPYMESNFFHASDINDFIAKYEFTGLRPGQKYFYRISYGKDTSNVTSSSWNSFKTLSQITSDKSTSFVVVSGMDYNAFSNDIIRETFKGNGDAGLKSGFPAFHAISYFKPDFWIGNGNNVYYDEPNEFPSTSQNEMRMHWHWLFSMPEFNKMLSHIPSYWMINDHDYWSDNSGTLQTDSSGDLNLPVNRIATEVFYEQVPIIAGNTERKSTYRTYRLNKDVQIWLLEGRLFRSPGSLKDVTGKSMWGTKQLTWLKSTLKESDAAFKLIISPTPLIGPDDITSTDNHTNTGGFRSERDSLFLWLKNNGFRNNGLYIICGDLQWQYHSIDPSGFEEFSCGTMVDGNFRSGFVPGDSLSTDGAGAIIQPYIQKEPSGGFLFVSSDRDEYNSPVLLFRFFDDQRKLLYAVNKY